MLFWYFHYFIKLNILFQYICYRYVVFNICYHFETEYVVILLLEMSYFHHFIHRSTLFILPVKAARCILQYTSLLINFIHAEAFNSTSRYLDDLLNIDNPYFEGMVNQIYPPELQLNKANISDTEAPFLDLHLSVANGFVSSKIYDKRDDFDFDIVNFPFLDGDVPRRASYGVYISQLIRFARVCNHVTDFNARNKCLTAKLLQQGYRYHKLRKTFDELISKYNVGLKTLLSEGLSEPEFYGDLVYKLKKLKGINDFSLQFGKIISRYRRIGYNLNVMRQSACLVFNPIMVDNYAAFFNCTPVGRASDSMMAPT